MEKMNLVNELTNYVLGLNATELVAQQPETATKVENTVIAIKETVNDRIEATKEAIKNTANKVVEGIKEATSKINLNMVIIASILIVLISGWLVANSMENKLDNEYIEAVEQLQQIETTVSFDSTNYFLFGNTESLLNELDNHKVQYKTIDNNRYYVVLDTDDNQNIVLKYNTIENKFYWYGKFDTKTADHNYKKDSIEVINSIL